MNILFLIALTFPVAIASTAFSINGEQLTINNLQLGRKLMFALILALGQGMMYSLGGLLGGTFMHLVAKHSQWIVLALCFSIAYRMVINTIKIKNGSNLYFVENKKQLLLLSIALGINAFIAGLMFEFLPVFQKLTPYIIVGISFIWAMTAMMIPFSKMKLTFNSLLNIILAAIIFARGLMFLI